LKFFTYQRTKLRGILILYKSFAYFIQQKSKFYSESKQN